MCLSDTVDWDHVATDRDLVDYAVIDSFSLSLTLFRGTQITETDYLLPLLGDETRLGDVDGTQGHRGQSRTTTTRLRNYRVATTVGVTPGPVGSQKVFSDGGHGYIDASFFDQSLLFLGLSSLCRRRISRGGGQFMLRCLGRLTCVGGRSTTCGHKQAGRPKRRNTTSYTVPFTPVCGR